MVFLDAAQRSQMHLLDEKVIPTIRTLYDSDYGVLAILLMGSTAFKSRFSDWDDFDLQVYTSRKTPMASYYEIIRDAGKRYLASAYFIRLDPTNNPKRTVLDQADVRILFGSKESLSHIFVDRPRRIEPLPHEYVPFVFASHYETLFNILVDIFFILNRYERRGRRNTIKPRVARDGLRTICRDFYLFYGINRPIPERAQWRTMKQDVVSLLVEKGFAEICRNRKFAEEAIELMRAD